MANFQEARPVDLLGNNSLRSTINYIERNIRPLIAYILNHP